MSAGRVFAVALGAAMLCAGGATAQALSPLNVPSSPLSERPMFAPTLEAMAAAYSDTMVRYRFFAEAKGTASDGYPIVDADELAPTVPWIWYGRDGSFIRRVNDGWFRITSADPMSNWFASIECRVYDWPQFSCSDGQNREMSAPSIDTIAFGGVQYRRQVSIPARDPAEQAAEDEAVIQAYQASVQTDDAQVSE